MSVAPRGARDRARRRPRPRRSGLAWVAALGLLCGLSGCARYQDTRGLHYVDGELVKSRPGDYRAYEAYVLARMALDSKAPDLAFAHRKILEALYYERVDPQLWTTRGEIELKMGKLERARRSGATALQLRPGYPPARQLLTKLSQAPRRVASGPR